MASISDVKDPRKLSVAFFSHSSGFDGAERCLLDLLKPLCEEGVICTVILPRQRGVFKEILLANGIEVFEASRTWWWVFGKHRLKSIGRLFRSWRTIETEVLPFLRRLDPDVVYSQTIVSPWGTYCAERLNKPHALSVREYLESLGDSFEFILGYEASMRLLYKKSQAVFWLTETVKASFRKFLQPQASKIEETIYGKFDVGSAGNDLRKRERPAGDVFKIGIFGRISENKGQEDLANASLEIKNRNIKARFYLVGSADEDYIKKINSLIDSAGTSGSFEILEHQEDPYQLMSEMDVVVSCSRNEAMGRTLPEAALLAVPIIFPDRGGPAEIFQAGVHGLTYSPGDHLQLARNIAEVHDGYSAALERAVRTREYVMKKFSKANYSDKVKDALTKIRDEWQGGASREVSDFLFRNKRATFDIRLLAKLYQWRYAVEDMFRSRKI
jgi:glycosyltransferase involved in cell wall biosynthesis